jgi:hypothetical protein
MKTKIPPPGDFPEGRLAERKQHLLSEIAGLENARGQARRLPDRPSTRRWRAIPVVALASAVVVALLLVSPWHGSPGLVERARAALGNAPVLHVVIEQPAAGLEPLVDIESGNAQTQRHQTEIWFDQDRGLEKTVEFLNGVLVDEMLETPQGGFTPTGPVITCAWIAAHPVEATKLRVSCNENLENGTTPQHVPERPPSLDARLADFVDHYRSALESGRAHVIGRDRIDGREVIWLRFTWAGATNAQGALTAQDVAVDASTYRPVRLRDAEGSWAADVTLAETLPYSVSLFRRPAQRPPQAASGSSQGRTPIALSDAAGVLRRPPLWLGREWHGLHLDRVEKLDLVTGYGGLTGHAPTHSSAIRLSYSAGGNPGSKPTLLLTEATTCELALFWPCYRPIPSEGHLEKYGFADTALARVHGLYLTITNRSSELDFLTIARSVQELGP